MIKDMQVFILGVLHSGPKNRGIMHIMGQQLKDFWNCERAHLYREVDRLVEMDLIIEPRGGVYFITDKGREEYRKRIEENDFCDKIRNSWILRLFLCEHDDTSIEDVCQSASAYHQINKLNTDQDLIGHLFISYNELMQEWFQKIGEMNGKELVGESTVPRIRYRKVFSRIRGESSKEKKNIYTTARHTTSLPQPLPRAR